MSQQTWLAASDDRITRLVAEYIRLDSAHGPLAEALRNPSSGALRDWINKYQCVGTRRHEGQCVAAFLLHHHRIEEKDIAAELGVDRTSVARCLNGESCSPICQKIYLRYRDELRSFVHPTLNELSIAGYSYAVDRLRADLLEMLGLPEGPNRPPMTDETFCFLWHMFQNSQWDQAARSKDPLELAHAAVAVHRCVKDALSFPTFNSLYEKPPETLLNIGKNWGISFLLVIFSSPDVLNYRTPHTP